MAKSYPTTEARGAQLAEEILDIIEVEDRLRRSSTPDNYGISDTNDKHPAWNQGTWATVELNKLPAKTNVEVLPPEVLSKIPNSYWRENFDRLVTVDSGVSCGTAMCFAGHAATLAGDKLIVALPSYIASEMSNGKPRKKLRGWLSRLRNKGFIDHDDNPGDAVEMVLTPDGRTMEISERARQLLGLTKQESELLFNAHNSLDTIRGYVKMLSEGRYLTTGRKRSTSV